MLTTSKTAKEIFLELVSRYQPNQWDEQLKAACGTDMPLRNRVHALLLAHNENDSFLIRPAARGLETIDVSPSHAIGTQIGPYKLLEQIGEGGMGLVYMAEQQRPVRRLVALKLIKPGMDTRQVIARFEAERQALAMMDHPNIAKVLDAGTTDSGRPYFVMELVRGLPINEFCDQKELTLPQRLELFIQVCQAVQHAHQKGIIHRDLKPTNVLVTRHDALSVPMVIDFGIAKSLGQQLTDHTLHTGYAQLIGTSLYMSPEQAEMNQLGVDTRSDIYSLGVMLYELLTGTTPFDKVTLSKGGLDEMRRILREVEPETVSTRLAKTKSSRQTPSAVALKNGTRSVPTTYELDWIVAKSLEKDRNRRYESASALAADIQRFLKDEPVQACPPSPIYRMQKFARRNRGAFATATAVMLALFAGITIATWQAIAARLSAAEARAATNLANERLAEANQQRKLASDRLEALEREQEITNSPGYQDYLVGVLHNEAQKVRREASGKAADFERLLNEAIHVRRRLVARSPEDPGHRDKLANLLVELADHRREQGDRQGSGEFPDVNAEYAESDQLFQEAIQIRRNLASQFPDQQPNNRHVLAGLLGTQAQLLRQMAQSPGSEKNIHINSEWLAQAEALFNERIALRRQLALEQPRNLTYRSGVAGTLRAEAVELRSLASSDLFKDQYEASHRLLIQADMRFSEAIEAQKKQALDFPSNSVPANSVVAYLREQAGSLRNRAASPNAREQPDQVLQWLTEADTLMAEALRLGRKMIADFPTVSACCETFVGLLQDQSTHLGRLPPGNTVTITPEEMLNRRAELESLVREATACTRRLALVEPQEPKHQERLVRLLREQALSLRQQATSPSAKENLQTARAQLAEAASLTEEAIKLLRTLAANYPNDSHQVGLLSYSLRQLALCKREQASNDPPTASQQLAQANEVYQEAGLLIRRLVADNPDNQGHRNGLGGFLPEYADFVLFLAKRDSKPGTPLPATIIKQVSDIYDEAIANKQQQTLATPSDIGAHNALAGLFLGKAVMLRQQAFDFAGMHKPVEEVRALLADSDRLFEEGALVLRQAVAENQNRQYFRRDFATYLTAQAYWIFQTPPELRKGQIGKAFARYDEAVSELRKLRIDFPNEIHFDDVLVQTIDGYVQNIAKFGAELNESSRLSDTQLAHIDGLLDEAIPLNQNSDRVAYPKNPWFKNRIAYLLRYKAANAERHEKVAKEHDDGQSQADHRETAERLYRESLAIAVQLVTDIPAEPELKNTLDSCLAALAEFLKKQNREDEFGALVVKLTEQLPGKWPIETRRADLLWSQGKQEEAIEALSAVIATMPNSFPLIAKRAGFYRSRGQKEKALDDYNRAIELNPRGEFQHYGSRGDLYVAMGEHEKAIADYTTVIDEWKKVGGGNRHLYKRRGAAYFYWGKFDEALVDLQEALAGGDFPGAAGDMSTLWWIPANRIASCPSADFKARFLKLADEAIERNPASSDALRGRGTLLAELGQISKAREDFQSILRDPTLPYYPRYHAALSVLKFDDFRAYKEACAEMLAKFAESKQPLEVHFTAWTCALAPLAVEDYEPAIVLARRAVSAAPGNSQYINGLGAILMRAGRYAEAAETLAAAAAAAHSELTSPAYTSYFLAMTQHRLGHGDEARLHLEQAKQQADQELADQDKPIAWYRRLTLELLHREATELLQTQLSGETQVAATRKEQNP